MRIAIVSDVHGNIAAFEAVLADLRETAPDLIFHGGDISHGGSDPAAVVDRIRALGWPGVYGNAEEMLFEPQSLVDFVNRTPSIQPLLSKIQEMGAWSRDALGDERVEWLSELPMRHDCDGIAIVHASPSDTYVSPWANASDEELASVYGPLGQPLVVYGHIHSPFVRVIGGLSASDCGAGFQPAAGFLAGVVQRNRGPDAGQKPGGRLKARATMTVANSGAVSQSFDGDRRASYLLVTDGEPEIRRLEYDVQREIQALLSCGFPHAGWIVKILETGRPQMP